MYVSGTACAETGANTTTVKTKIKKYESSKELFNNCTHLEDDLTITHGYQNV